jgi:hypothetical protein
MLLHLLLPSTLSWSLLSRLNCELVKLNGADEKAAAAAPVAAAVLAKQFCALKERAAATGVSRQSKVYAEAAECMLNWMKHVMLLGEVKLWMLKVKAQLRATILIVQTIRKTLRQLLLSETQPTSPESPWILVTADWMTSCGVSRSGQECWSLRSRAAHLQRP